MTDAEQTAAPPTGGYRTPPRYRVVHGGEGTQYEGLWVEIRCNLRGFELDALNDDEQSWRSLEALMAPFVVGWNVLAPVKVKREIPPETGPDGKPRGKPTHVVTIEEELLPPPAEAGPAVFRRVDDWVKIWIRSQLAVAPYAQGGQTLKPSTRSGLTPSGPPAAIEPSPSAAPSPKKNRRSDRAATAS